MKVLITLGPTEEPIDAVRFVSNSSSGKMGAALAEASMKRGHKTTIVAGPVSIPLPDCKTIRVRTAQEMTDASLRELKKGYDLFICSAAIADYAPVRAEKKKIKSDKPSLTIKLKATPKLTREARKRFPDLFIVAFKAEANLTRKELYDIAYSKLKKEKLDMIAANDVGKNRFGSDVNELILIGKTGDKTVLSKKTKKEIAKEMMGIIEKKI